MTNAIQTVSAPTREHQLVTPITTMPSPQEWSTIFQMAEALVPTGFLPRAVDTPAKAAAIMLKGRELGVPPMAALAGMAVINGKVTVQADLMMAMIKRQYGRDVIWVESSTDEACKVGYKAGGAIRYYEYTIQMADKAGLTKNDTYRKHPAAMLRARNISAVGKMEFPEVAAGLYVPGELGDDVGVDEETGEIITVSVSAPPAPQQLDHGTEMRRMHGIAANHGITHDMISAYFTQHKKKKGTNEGTAAEFSALSKRIEANPEGALKWMSSLVETKSLDSGDTQPEPEPAPESVEIPSEEVRSTQRDIWELAVDNYGWTGEQLDAVASKVTGKRYREADANELNTLYIELVTADEAKRAEMLKVA